MATDDDRREVARRLRSLDDSELQVYDMTYFAIQCAVGGGVDQHPDGRELADRLADLIEPATADSECSANVRDATRTFGTDVERSSFDRDALLALADEIEYGAGTDDGEYDDMPGFMVAAIARQEIAYARRIREALGVES